MNNSVGDLLKTSVEDISRDAVVFSTSITLNQRFSNLRPNELVLANGFTQPYRNNQLKRRVAFGYRPCVKISNRFSLYKSENSEKLNECKIGRKEEIWNAGKTRRTVLMPKKAKKENSTERFLDIDGDEETSQYRNIKASTPKPTRTDYFNRRDSIESHFHNLDEKTEEHDSSDQVRSSMLTESDCVAQTSNQNSKEPIVFSAFHLMAKKKRKSLYSQNRRQESRYKLGEFITKEDLDSEIDAYMAETKLIVPVSPTDNALDPFAYEYMMDVDQYSDSSLKFG